MAVVSLLDALPVTENVPIGNDQELQCSGISFAGGAMLFGRFPELKDALSGKVDELNAERVLTLAPSAISAVIAAGTGFEGNQKAEKIAAGLPLQIQLNVVEAIIRRTMPDGAGPFVAKVAEYATYGKGFIEGVTGKAEVGTNSEATSQDHSIS